MSPSIEDLKRELKVLALFFHHMLPLSHQEDLKRELKGVSWVWLFVLLMDMNEDLKRELKVQKALCLRTAK